MNTITAATTSSTPYDPILGMTLARTDKEFGQALEKWRFQSRKKIERPDTSLKTEEWKKQLYFNYLDSRGNYCIFPILSVSNSEDNDFRIKDSYSRFSSSERLSRLSKNVWSEWVTGSTSSTETHKEKILEKVEALFRAYANEEFVDGMENEFVNELMSYISKYGNNAVSAIFNIIISGSARPQVIFEALRWLGTLTHTTSYHSRLFLLEKSLRSSSRWIRDGAALGLASMKDTHAIPYLREAIDKEKIKDLRKDMEAVLAHLECVY